MLKELTVEAMQRNTTVEVSINCTVTKNTRRDTNKTQKPHSPSFGKFETFPSRKNLLVPKTEKTWSSLENLFFKQKNVSERERGTF